jgi:hypothetical protein
MKESDSFPKKFNADFQSPSSSAIISNLELLRFSLVGKTNAKLSHLKLSGFSPLQHLQSQNQSLTKKSQRKRRRRYADRSKKKKNSNKENHVE